MNDNTSAVTLKTVSGLQRILLMVCITAGYLLLSYILIGFRPEQLFLSAAVNLLYFASAPSRKFISGFAVFVVYWIIFDYMKAFPNYRFGDVHIASIYHAEKAIFGIHYNGLYLTPNEFWLQNGSTLLDVVSGFFYLTWVPVPLLFAAYLFYKNKKQFLYFSYTFLLVNLIGFVIYYVCPAAPPWYVQQYGFTFQPHTPGNTAGLAKFDEYFHVSIFNSLYAKSSNVFAAMPSLHSSYPVIVFYYGLKNRLGLINILLGTIMCGIWFAAIYTGHHYILDVLAGIMCACAGIALFNMLGKRGFIKNGLDKLAIAIS
ncbi:phosphatase PAP2 family protein [Chitinophagaceae bacterium MMS25-I14]